MSPTDMYDDECIHYPAHGECPDVKELKAALEEMVRKFAYWSNRAGGYTTGGLSALESAFDALGWDDPHPAPEARCDEPGCMEQASVGTPTPTGYRRTCHKHAPKQEG
jgi:hypothetical protein